MHLAPAAAGRNSRSAAADSTLAFMASVFSFTPNDDFVRPHGACIPDGIDGGLPIEAMILYLRSIPLYPGTVAWTKFAMDLYKFQPKCLY